eukprot:TRINITY_DN5391_c0_g1_i1.p1 TRINITY_DN5391_c0_g1~~TRINITY_DN5391_c0_g1_i1.p1  ORF type:complete len:155 (+),score=46.68 TRINITY_DN5391_c0_g1_i1:61-465(+)
MPVAATSHKTASSKAEKSAPAQSSVSSAHTSTAMVTKHRKKKSLSRIALEEEVDRETARILGIAAPSTAKQRGARGKSDGISHGVSSSSASLMHGAWRQQLPVVGLFFVLLVGMAALGWQEQDRLLHFLQGLMG